MAQIKKKIMAYPAGTRKITLSKIVTSEDCPLP